MRLYNFVPSKWGLENLRRRRLKISTLDRLNDPFELLAATSASPAHRAAFRRAKAQRAGEAGLLCFSRDWKNLVQWSHYADWHRGLCLGFDVADADCKPVCYRKTRIGFEPALLDEADAAAAFMDRIAGVKFTDWAYEKEVRVWRDLAESDRSGDLYFAPFGDRLVLREVILGAECDTDRTAVGEALGDLTAVVRVRNARLAFKRFQITEQRDAQRWR